MEYQYKNLRVKEHLNLTGTKNTAVYSLCEKYRFFLERVWDANTPPLVMLMLNPSTATELQNDPTVERCERRARQNGYGGLQVLNIFSLRSTDPKNLYQTIDPVGKYNDFFIRLILKQNAKNDNIVCGWGTHGRLNNREQKIFSFFEKENILPMAFKWTKTGHPQHPLYISYDEQPKQCVA